LNLTLVESGREGSRVCRISRPGKARGMNVFLKELDRCASERGCLLGAVCPRGTGAVEG